MQDIIAVDVPEESALRSLLADAYFFDAYRAPLSDASLSPAGISCAPSR